MLISLRMSLLCTLIVALSGCLPVTIVGGVIGISDSIGKNRRMDRIELRIAARENISYNSYQSQLPIAVTNHSYQSQLPIAVTNRSYQ